MNSSKAQVDTLEIKTFLIASCAVLGLLLIWGAYLKKGDNQQRAKAWLKSDSRSTKAFRMVMAVLSLAVVGHIIVDICQLLFGRK